MTTNHVETSDVLAECFSTVYVKEVVTNMPDFSARSCNQINSLSITGENLLQNLSQLNASKAMSLDKIHT